MHVLYIYVYKAQSQSQDRHNLLQMNFKTNFGVYRM